MGHTKDGRVSLQFPRTHLILVCLLCLGLASFVIAKFNDDPAADRFTTDSVLLDLPPAEAPLELPAAFLPGIR